MNWGGWNEFWAMGGYALYVWGSYGMTLVLIAAEIAAVRSRRRAAAAATSPSGAQNP